MSQTDFDAALDRYGDIPIDIRVELDRTRVRLSEILSMKEGYIMALTKPAGEPLDIYVGGVSLGRGEIMVLHDNLGVRVTAHAGNEKKKTSSARSNDDRTADVGELLKHAPREFRDSRVLNSMLDGFVTVGVVVGRAWLPLERVVRLGPGSFLELESSLNQPAEVAVDGQVLAYGEVVVVDGNYGIRILSVADRRSARSGAGHPVLADA